MEGATASAARPMEFRPAPPPLPDLDFERFVEGWQRLAPDIRARFAEHPMAAHPIRYAGVMQQVQSNAAGWLLAQICRWFGTPFAPGTGTDVPMSIRLLDRGPSAVEWERTYHFPDRVPVTVRSTKQADATLGLLECVGGGFGMHLAVFERDGALHFESRRYFWRYGRVHIWLPRWLTPGVAHIVHIDLGAGRFRFTMTFQHRWFGTLFRQGGVFEREGD